MQPGGMDLFCLRPQGIPPGVGKNLRHNVLDLCVSEDSRLLVVVGSLDRLQHDLAIPASVKIESGERLNESWRLWEASLFEEPAQVLGGMISQRPDRLDEHTTVSP